MNKGDKRARKDLGENLLEGKRNEGERRDERREERLE